MRILCAGAFVAIVTSHASAFSADHDNVGVLLLDARGRPNYPDPKTIVGRRSEFDRYFDDIKSHVAGIANIGRKRGNRFIGSKGDEETYSYITRSIDRNNFDLQVQSIDTHVSRDVSCGFKYERNDPSSGGTKWSSGDCAPMEYSPDTPSSGIEGELVAVDDIGCKQENYPSRVRGRIALVSRGGKTSCGYGVKANLARRKGATGIVFVNREDRGRHGHTLSNPDANGDRYVPAVGISAELGNHLMRGVRDLRKSIRVKIQSRAGKNTPVRTRNIIAESKSGSSEKVILIGAHMDSVEDGPGINDNASGCAALLSLIDVLGKYDLRYKVRVAFWTGEEEGLIGSSYYVRHLSSTERRQIAIYENWDMMASPNWITELYAKSAHHPTTRNIHDYLAMKGVPDQYVFFDLSPSFDTLPFELSGIPTIGLGSGMDDPKSAEEQALFGGEVDKDYDPNYHKATDTLSKFNLHAFRRHAEMCFYSAIAWSNSLRGLGCSSHGLVARNETGPSCELP